MTTVVISQPMYFPWIGMFEQIRLCDTFMFYDDVQFSKGSFTNRVQIKFPDGEARWMTVPLKEHRSGQKINEVRINEKKDWKNQHFEVMKQSLKKSPYFCDALSILENVFSKNHETVGAIAAESMCEVMRYFGLDKQCKILYSSESGVAGESSERVHAIVKALGGDVYVSGMGGLRYLNHELFEKDKIEVKYMDYRKTPYPQHNGVFTPYVTVLDLIANVGKDGINFIHSEAVYWKNIRNE